MPYLNDDEIENLISRAVSKAIGKKRNRQFVSEITNASDDDRLLLEQRRFPKRWRIHRDPQLYRRHEWD
jgi:hypothetical protein